jgi:hypothetical protein
MHYATGNFLAHKLIIRQAQCLRSRSQGAAASRGGRDTTGRTLQIGRTVVGSVPAVTRSCPRSGSLVLISGCQMPNRSPIVAISYWSADFFDQTAESSGNSPSAADPSDSTYEPGRLEAWTHTGEDDKGNHTTCLSGSIIPLPGVQRRGKVFARRKPTRPERNVGTIL